MAPSSRAKSVAPGGQGVGVLARRPSGFLALAILITVLLSLGLRGLHTEAATDLLADPRAGRMADEAVFEDAFGADPIVVLLEARPGEELISGSHFVGLARLEEDLADAEASPGVKNVSGPGRLLRTLAFEVTRPGLEKCSTEARAAQDLAFQKAATAGMSVEEQKAAGAEASADVARTCSAKLAAGYPGLGIPALDNPRFVRQVLLDPDGMRSRSYWSWALPDPTRALITVRMDPHASLSQVRKVLATVEKARHGPFRPSPASAGVDGSLAGQQPGASTVGGDLSDLTVTVTGGPALAVSEADAMQASLVLLLSLTLLALLLVAILAVSVPMRILAVPIAAVAAVWTAGAAGWAGLPLTPAMVAVLPIVLGLATGNVLQALNRLTDEDTGGPTGRVARAAHAILPPGYLAASAALAGGLAFAFAMLPLVRQFALILVLGVAMAYLAPILIGIPLFSVVMSSDLRRLLARRLAKPAWRGLAIAGRLPLAAVVPLVLIGLVGWAALPRLDINSDPARIVPAPEFAFAQAEHVRREVGWAGEIDLVIVGPRVASPEALRWLDGASRGISSGQPTLVRRQISLPSFLGAFNQGQEPDQALARMILGRLPRSITGAVLNGDGTVARSVFSLTSRLSVEQEAQLVTNINRAVAQPPPGYRGFAAGIGVVRLDALRRVRGDLLPLNLFAVALVLAVLLVAYRRLGRALVALLPPVVAAGWATGLLLLAHTAADPITALMAGLLVAFATQFSVLWLARYSSARRAGVEVGAASAEASVRVGPAIVASALALAAGFAMLATTSIPMLREMGLWSAAGVLLALVAVLVILPPLARRVVA